MFIPWSIANISNIPVDEYRSAIENPDGIYPALVHDEVEQFVRKSGGRVIKRKGATFYAVSISVCHLAKCLLSGMDTTLTVSTMLHGEYGIDDVCLSLLNNVGRKMVSGKVMLPLADNEIADLKHSADCLKEIIRQVDI